MRNIKTLLNNMVQTITGRVKDVTITADGSTNGVIGLDLSRYNKYDMVYKSPVIYPYGYCSIPVKNSTAVIGNLSVGNGNPIVSGFLYASLPPVSLIKEEGESLLFSNGIGVNLLNDAIRVKYKTSTCSLPSGEDVGTILADILTQIKELIAKVNLNYLTYNTHTHPADNTVTPSTVTPIVQDPVIQRDLAFVQADKHLINTTTGVTPVS